MLPASAPAPQVGDALRAHFAAAADALLDATIVRGILVPAIMTLAGERIWWSPAPLKRLHTRIGLSEAGTHPAPAPATEPDLVNT